MPIILRKHVRTHAILVVLSLTICCLQVSAQLATKPNIVVVFCDDLGYGDLGIFGHPTIMTPNLDRMAMEGQKWTNFYVSAPVCTPSRAGLLTGRFAVRSGMASNSRRVLFPDSKGGLPKSEITIAQQLKSGGYATAIVGKWHLGHLPEYLPNAHGFDEYFGIPYSNDMDFVGPVSHREAFDRPKMDYFNVPLKRNNTIIEQPADQTTITKRYTEEAIKFMNTKRDKPFFLYLAHSMPHVPLFRSKDFENKSLRGLYGDVIEELDWSVGQVLESLRKSGLAQNTLVIFTSDNGPWLTQGGQGGSAGLLKGGKGGNYEGGMREPTIFWWPGKIKPGVNPEIGTTLDLFPTFSKLAGIKMPSDRVYDGYDISPVIFGTGSNPRNEVIYYRDTDIYAVRVGAYKAHFVSKEDYGNKDVIMRNPPELYNLNEDPSEKYNIASKNPKIVTQLRAVMEKHQASVVAVENQLEKR